jgi:FtsP/CotA-like multicopper oxidase with cupredoxin domain
MMRVTRRGTALGAGALGAGAVAVALLAFGAFSGGKGTASAADTKPMDMGMPGMGGMNMDMSGEAMTGKGYWQDVAGGGFHSDGVTRTYYIAADKVVWDYAPKGLNEITGKPFDDVADTYIKRGPGRIGSRYVKCLYRGYTDATFQHLERRPQDQRYLGLLGPVIRAEVGDTIKVVFRNNCPFPASVHPHGVFYKKDSEGAPYNDGTSGEDKSDDAVPTGGTHTYTWEVPERAGPAPGDTSSVMWMYHSHTDEVADTYAGLMGPIEVTARGMARSDGSPKDVDREFFVLFSVMNENQSPFLVENLHRFAEKPYPTDLDDDDFTESNLMHSINGYVFGNGPMMKMRKGERVRWYVMSMGTEVDLHTPHWHGNTVVVNGMRMDTVSLLPAGMIVADMVPDDPGIWLFHCHVNDHIRAGMLTRYEVLR